jgi:hypothetical protein
VAAALLCVLCEPIGRRRRLLHFCLGVLLGCCIALPWFLKNGALVAQYLFSYGYGGHAAAYGPQVAVFTPQAVWLKLQFYINAEFHLPLFVIICLGVLALVFATVRDVAERGIGAVARSAFTAPVLPVIVFNLATLLALFSSANRGGGFLAPVVPSLMVQTAWALARLRAPAAIKRGIYVLSVAAAVATFVPMIALTPLARSWTLNLPMLGAATVTAGEGNIQRYEFQYGYGTESKMLDRQASFAWVRLSDWTAMRLARQYGAQADVMFGFRNALYNVNTVDLQDLRASHAAFAMQQIDPVATGMSVAGYQAWLVKDGAAACALLTSNESKGDFDPQVDPDLMRQAAMQAGFVPVTSWPAPDGQQIILWRHRAGGPGCARK